MKKKMSVPQKNSQLSDLDEIFFLLKFSYETKNDNEYYIFIGVFSSEEKGNEAIEFSIQENGFKDYPRSCYKIEKVLIDNYSIWIHGFKKKDLTLLS